MIKIDFVRDGLIEESHEGVWAIYKPVKNFLPDTEREVPYYLRSCAKPLQATLLIENNIGLTPEELAFCCGSHAGEECHIDMASKLLKKLSIDEDLLKCGIHAPLSKSMQTKMVLRGEKPSSLHNNCSGKHIGFLAICKKNGWNTADYFKPEHPLQIAVKNKIYDMCGIEENYPQTTDGCGVPIVSMPLKNLVKGYIRLLEYPQIIGAIKDNPYIFGGEDRLDTEIIMKTENLIAKVGAGGLCVVLNIKEKNAFAVKINDASMEARRFAVLELINRLGWGNIEYDNKIKTIAGKIVGETVVIV